MRLKTTHRQCRSTLATMAAPILALAAVFGSGSPAVSADPVPDATLVFPAGRACQFELQVDVFGANQVYREFTDRNGNVVRTLSAGKGSALTFTNLETGATFSSDPNGAVQHTIFDPDDPGSYTQTVTGHNVIILFPTDSPAGPSTTLYVGRVTYTVDPDGVFTMGEGNGRKTDLCDALSE